MTFTRTPDQTVHPVVGKLFGMITVQLEVAHEKSIEGHQSERGHDQIKRAMDSVHVQLADVATLVEAIEALLSDDH